MVKDNAEVAASRQFEKLVALIESHLVPHGARVESPDHIPDRITGELREVDASVQYQVGSVPILITIECRDRTRVADVTWIEQIATKGENIGASATVAVSSKGFSKAALEKARFLGIETRLLREVSNQAIQDWAQKMQIVRFRGQFYLGNLYLQFRPTQTNPAPELHPRVKTEYGKGDAEFKFIRRNADGVMTSIADLLRDEDRKAGHIAFAWVQQSITVHMAPQSEAEIVLSSRFTILFEGVPFGGEVVTKTLTREFAPNEVSVETIGGMAEVARLGAELRVFYRAYPSNIGRLLSYESELGRVLYVEERDLSLGETDSVKVIISGGSNQG